MKTTEIREMSASELDSKLAGLKEELFNLRFQMATGQCAVSYTHLTLPTKRIV